MENIYYRGSRERTEELRDDLRVELIEELTEILGVPKLAVDLRILSGEEARLTFILRNEGSERDLLTTG